MLEGRERRVSVFRNRQVRRVVRSEGMHAAQHLSIGDAAIDYARCRAAAGKSVLQDLLDRAVGNLAFAYDFGVTVKAWMVTCAISGMSATTAFRITTFTDRPPSSQSRS